MDNLNVCRLHWPVRLQMQALPAASSLQISRLLLQSQPQCTHTLTLLHLRECCSQPRGPCSGGEQPVSAVSLCACRRLVSCHSSAQRFAGLPRPVAPCPFQSASGQLPKKLLLSAVYCTFIYVPCMLASSCQIKTQQQMCFFVGWEALTANPCIIIL